ncbi:DUF6350 family protein [Tessaracoccus oleiagri]|uniref:Uncharacterized protein n=1 Tax=Tessaracoccus oleiagri TaxID=686624 RepID=A0A1G9JL00_9ACTN|nr:DUF6350 family protein [Tessaracoccus oleiagri]SDL38209.1 hypothetical protein SAMN04488242_1326 [Tessaracoccus oleiagri]
MADLTRTVAVDVDEQPAPPRREFTWPWPLPAVLGALGVALAGWVLLGGTATVVWLASADESLAEALELATRVFALAHGAPVELAGQRVTLVPLGLTFVLVFLALPVVGFAARLAAGRDVEPGGDGAVHADPDRIIWWVGGTYAATYTLAVTAVTGAVVGGPAAASALVGSGLVGLVAGLWGAANGLGHDPTSRWPGWVRAVPRAMGVALAMLLAGGAVALGLALYAGRGRVGAITESLDPGVVGLVALAVLHLIYLPNLVLWAVSWLLGAGVTLGDGSLLSLVISDVGMLPAIPALGAVPEPGLASQGNLWWLAIGVVAGALAALVVTLARPRARFDETALVGALSGVLAGLLVTAAASVASGGLGTDRLAHIGARTGQLAVFAPTLLGLAGLVAGLALGLLRRPAPAGGGAQTIDEEEEGER